MSQQPVPLRAGPVVTEIHSDTEAHLTVAVELDAEGMTLRRTPALTKVGRHLWLELGLDDGSRMRVLATVVGRSPETTRVRFKHVWPRDRQRYQDLVQAAVLH